MARRHRSKSLQPYVCDSFEVDLFLSDQGFNNEAKIKYARPKSSPPYVYDSLQRYLHLSGYDPTQTQAIDSISSNASYSSIHDSLRKSLFSSGHTDPKNTSQTAENSSASLASPSFVYDSSLSGCLDPDRTPTVEHSSASTASLPHKQQIAEHSSASNASPPILRDSPQTQPNKPCQDLKTCSSDSQSRSQSAKSNLVSRDPGLSSSSLNNDANQHVSSCALGKNTDRSQTGEQRSASISSSLHESQIVEHSSASAASLPQKSQIAEQPSAPDVSPPIFHNRPQKLNKRNRKLKNRFSDGQSGSASVKQNVGSQDLGLSSSSPSTNSNQPASSSASKSENTPKELDPAKNTAQQPPSSSSAVSSNTIRSINAGPILDNNNVASSSSKPPPSIVDNGPIYITFPPKRDPANDDLGPFGCTECYIPQLCKDSLLNLPYFCQYEPEKRTKLNHRLKNSSIKGIGKGLFANNDMKTGDLVFSERPLLIAPGYMLGSRVGIDSASEDPKTVDDWEAKLKVLLSRMSSERRKAFLALADVHDTKKGGKCGKLLGILRTNGICLSGYFRDFHFQFPEGIREVDGEVNVSRADCFAVGELLSRINHSCAPNLVRNWENSSFSFRVSAIRPIAKGEELTIAYTPLLHCTNDRQTLLSKTHKFVCKCNVCTSSKSSKLYEHNANVRTTLEENTETCIDLFYSTACPLTPENEFSVMDFICSFLVHIENAELQACNEYKDLVSLVALHYIRNGNMEEAKKYATLYMELTKARFTVREGVEEGRMLKWAEINGGRLKIETGAEYAVISNFFKGLETDA